jgi:phosphohistidine phosphatase
MLRIALIRHAIAEDRDEAKARGVDDEARALTALGRKKFQAQLKRLIMVTGPISLIAPSPLVRAQETAKILGKCFPDAKFVTCPALTPKSDPEALLRWLRREKSSGTVALVGHEPDLGQLVSFLVWGNRSGKVRFKKGGLCILEFAGILSAGKAEILCLMQPQTLRS